MFVFVCVVYILIRSISMCVSMQAKYATSPTPSSLTCAATNVCTLTAVHRSSARTAGRCSAPHPPSTSIGASVKGKTISQQGGCLPRVCHSLAPLAWTNQLWRWATAVLGWLIILGQVATMVGLPSLLPQPFPSASPASSLLDSTTGLHSFLPLHLSDKHPMHQWDLVEI